MVFLLVERALRHGVASGGELPVPRVLAVEFVLLDLLCCHRGPHGSVTVSENLAVRPRVFLHVNVIREHLIHRVSFVFEYIYFIMDEL